MKCKCGGRYEVTEFKKNYVVLNCEKCGLIKVAKIKVIGEKNEPTRAK